MPPRVGYKLIALTRSLLVPPVAAATILLDGGEIFKSRGGTRKDRAYTRGATRTRDF